VCVGACTINKVRKSTAAGMKAVRGRKQTVEQDNSRQHNLSLRASGPHKLPCYKHLSLYQASGLACPLTSGSARLVSREHPLCHVDRDAQLI
jgi:hypothetical protein